MNLGLRTNGGIPSWMTPSDESLPTDATSDPNVISLRARQTGTTLLSTGLISAAGIVSGALVARLLGPSDRGLLAAILLWPTIVAYVGDLGGPSGYTYLSSAKRDRVPELVGNLLALGAVQSGILIVIGIPIAVAAMQAYPSAMLICIAFTITYLPLNLFTRYANALNQGLGRFGQFNAVRMTVQFVYVAAVVALFVIRAPRLDLIVGATVLSNVAALLVAVVPMFGWRIRKPRLDVKTLRATFAYGLRAQVGNLNPMEGLQIDLAVVFLFLGPHAAGLYAIALASTIVLRAAGVSFGMVALPSVAASVDVIELQRAFARSFRLALLMLVPAALVLIALAGILVPLVYGGSFLNSVPVVRILTVGAVAASLRRVLGDCLRGSGHPMAASVSEVMSLAVGLPALALLVARYGINGAAIAAGLSYSTALAASVIFAWRLVMIRPRDLFAIRLSDVQTARAVLRHTIWPA
jgi:O-antigen/teichoic acid export membrane protein